MNHTALIGDIKGSRKIENWSEVFGKLVQILDEVNRRYKDDVLIPFKPTIGDEFQGALQTPEHAYDVYTFIKASLPVGIYCGLGIGDIEKAINGDTGLRGSAFYRARDAMELCKSTNRNLKLKSSDAIIQSDEIVNTICYFIEVLENSWTTRQREVIRFYRLHPDYTYEKVGQHFKTSKQTVNKIVRAADWKAILEGEQLITELFKSKLFQLNGT